MHNIKPYFAIHLFYPFYYTVSLLCLPFLRINADQYHNNLHFGPYQCCGCFPRPGRFTMALSTPRDLFLAGKYRCRAPIRCSTVKGNVEYRVLTSRLATDGIHLYLLSLASRQRCVDPIYVHSASLHGSRYQFTPRRSVRATLCRSSCL